MSKRLRVLGWVLGLGVMASCAPKPAVYEPSEVQRLKLENIQLKQRDAFRVAQQAVAEYNAVDEQRRAVCDEVAKANKWPSETKCELTNPNDLVSKLIFKVPEKKPDAKPADKK